MTWNEYEKQEKEFLDSIDLLPFLMSKKELYTIMQEINEKYNDSYPEQFPIFTHLDKYDFYEYLINRYPKIKIIVQKQQDKYIVQ